MKTTSFDILIVIVVFSGFIAIIIVIKLLQWRQTKLKKSQKLEFISKSISGLQNGTIKNLDDVEELYRMVRGLSHTAIVTKGYIISWLKEAVHAIQKFESINEEELVRYVDFLRDVIDDLSDQVPFSDLPRAERELMTEILLLIKNSQEENEREGQLFINKLHDLGYIVKARYEDNKKLRDTTKWSVPLAIIGIAVSLIGLIFAFYTFNKK